MDTLVGKSGIEFSKDRVMESAAKAALEWINRNHQTLEAAFQQTPIMLRGIGNKTSSNCNHVIIEYLDRD